jgi:hypothetical protein
MNLQQSAHVLVPLACEELLLSIGHSPKKHASADLAPLFARPENYAAGIIEFTGDGISGSVMFLSDFNFFAATLPIAGRKRATPKLAADRLRIRDMAMELSNQLLGRIKNQLYRRGVVLEPTLPHAVSDDAIRVVVRERKQAPHVYLAGEHKVFVWFDATTVNAVSILPEADVVGEGGYVEF